MTPDRTPIVDGITSIPTPLGVGVDELGECGVWWPERNQFWWTDVRGLFAHVLDLPSGDRRSYALPELAGGMCLTDADTLLIGLERRLAELDPDTGNLTTLATTDFWSPGMRFNEIKCDPEGRVWAGYMNDRTREPVGWLFRIDRGTFVPMLDRVAVPNSLIWSPDGSTMLFSAGVEPTIDAYDFDSAKGTISNRREILAFPERGVPDGVALDAEGYFWCAHYAGGRIVRASFDGVIDRDISMPVSQPTAVTFGGIDLDVLFITSARQRLTDAQLTQQQAAGELFAMTTDVPGVPVPRATMRLTAPSVDRGAL